MAGNDVTVNVVDDDQDMRNALEWLLSRKGFRVVSHAAPEEFLQSEERLLPGCFIFDWQMPGMNGLELWQALQSQGIHNPWIVITGHSSADAKSSVLEAGGEAFLEKPFAHDELLRIVDEILAKAVGRASLTSIIKNTAGRMDTVK